MQSVGAWGKRGLRWAVGVATVAVALAVQAEEKGEIINRVEAVVGRDIITTYEVEQRLGPFQRFVDDAPPEKRPAVRKEMREEMVQNLINERLMASAASRMQINVSSAEVEAAMDRVAQQNGLTRTQMLEEVVKSGLTEKSYREELARQILEYKVLHAVISPPLDQRGLNEKELGAALAMELAKFLDGERARTHVEVRK